MSLMTELEAEPAVAKLPSAHLPNTWPVAPLTVQSDSHEQPPHLVLWKPQTGNAYPDI